MSSLKAIPSAKEEDERDCPLKIGDRVRAVFYSPYHSHHGKLIDFIMRDGLRYARVRYDGRRYLILVKPEFLLRA